MDASNEFKVFLSPTSASASKGKKSEGESGAGVRQRLVPVINKVFSPSHFMLAQRKTTVYKAVSGVSFQDIDIGGKRKSSSNKREKKDRKPEKKDGIYNPASEGELSLQSTKSERVRSFLGVRGEGRAAARRHRHSLGSNSDRPSIFLNDSEKSGSKKSRIRSVSTADNLYLSQDKGGDAPEKPLRSRSASRPRKSVSKVTVDSNTGTGANSGQKGKEDEEDKEDAGKGDSADKREEGESDKKAQSRARKKVSGRSRKSCPDQFGRNEKAKEERQDEEPEGGYFSLEKEERAGGDIKYIYEALPSNSSEEYLENDQCVEAIYVCQVMKRDMDVSEEEEPIYENCQLVKSKSANFVSTRDEDENCPAVEHAKEKEQEDTNKEGRIANLAVENPLALTRVTATQARLSRRRPAGSVDSIPYIDDSENSGDESVTRSPRSPRIKPSGSVTVVTIKEDDNMEVTRKVGPLRSQGMLSSSEDGVDESASEGGGKPEQPQIGGNAKPEDEGEAGCAPRRPARYSYPATSPSGMRVCNKVGRRLARFTPASVEGRGSGTSSTADDARVKKSMSHGDVQTHVEGRDGPLSESFSDDDIRHNEEFESFSETDSDLNNLDYELFLPREGRGGAGRSPQRTKRKPRGRSLSASQADPLLISTPTRAPRAAPRRRVSTSAVSGGSGDLQSPKTFQDLLGDKHLNPPEGEAASQPRDGQKLVPLIIRETVDEGDPSGGVAATQAQGGEQQLALDDTLSFTWSDAESEFEFIDFNKVEPPKTCVVYKGLAVTCAVVALSTATTTTTTAAVCTDKKVAGAVKRTQSMKVVGERVSSRGEAGLRWEPLLCVLPEGLAASHQGGLVRSVSGVSIRRSVRADGSRYTATSVDAKTSQDDTGAVARVTHGGQGSAPPSPQLSSSRSADNTPKKNILQRIKLGARNASKTTKGIKTARGSDSCVEGGGEDGLPRSHSHDDLYHSPGRDGHAPSPQQSRSRHQNQDEMRRTENTLKIWIMEAKEIPSKKKYFCHLIVDLQPSHRTCSKPMTNMCFWGEYFELDLSPEITSIVIELKREGDKKSNKKIGSVEIDLKPSSPGRATQEEQWYPVKVEKQDKTTPALRIRHRFQSLDILPLSQYGSLLQYLKENATPLCQLLEPVLPVKAKEDIATILINILQAENCAIAFLVDLVYTDIKTNAENEHLLFRGNSVATKAIEAYMKLVGEQYLHDTLKDPILALITSAEDLEVDPLKITNVQFLKEHHNSLREKVTAVWEKILQSSRNFPVELREVFHKLREQLSRQEKCELTDNLISSCVFLRFFCPAVLSPYLFNMATAYPDDRASRNLTLVAKTLQTLANFTLFQGKEKFMEFLNEFISKEQERCRAFLRAISSPPSPEDSILEFDGKIDRGKYLALLHLHLVDVLAEMNTQGYQSEASKVMALVEDISALLGGNHTVRRPSSGPILHGSPALVPPQITASNNNFTREESTDGIEETGTGLGMPPPSNRSQSFPRSVTPIYPHHHMVTNSPRQPFHHHVRSTAGDLGTSEEHVLITAFDPSSRPQISMIPSEEANNNNPPSVEMRVNNSNSYYMGEVPPPPLHQVHHQPQRALLHNTAQTRQHLRGPPSRNLSVGEVQSSADRRVYDRNCSEFFRYMDDAAHKFIAACKDGENNIQGSQTSISQLSNIASSGYQSFAYSQSSSPVDSLLHTDNSSLLSRENGNPGLPVGIRQVHHDSPLESPNSSLSSSQSVEDLSSMRRGRTRQRRSASSSSDSSPDSHPPSHSNSHFRRAPAHTPRTNPHCSPRLVPSPALRHELRSAKQRHDRSVSSRRGRSNRSSEREDLRGPSHCCDDSEDDLNVAVGSLGGAGAGGWVREGWQEHHHLLAHNLPPQQLLDQQEDQMRVIIERLMSMEQEFRHEQEMMRREMHYKDARIDAQEKKIAALDSANTHLIRTIASLNSRPGELKPDLSGDLHNDSCNASDTSDYKSSSC
ncbi:uncharacterized protein LOC123506307 isoform X2 [Portunus trituberculatus]|uniref:uncharacterized protein LOC123506307 isoform X2 n=1 Tax=Portunus trituberculatus TaxID=210409 RepID=UPI001E1CC391|nr:uncharacterized protein LOC123506307 isoform X2 [Portunus trituberculatus]